ncbi:MAG: glycoside hydrolase family 88 protein [Bacillota bacterium]|nr:glycoside hydrolase family 88 protein [Bacillota bacterium]
MIVLVIFLSIFSLISAIIFGIDFVSYLKDRYCRYHIGRFKNDEEWIDKVIKTSVRWAEHTPTVKITDNNRLVFIDILTGNYRCNTIQSWQKAAIILGLYEYNKEDTVLAARNAVSNLLDSSGNWKVKPTNVDCGMLSYAILTVSKDKNSVKPAMDTSLEIIKNAVCSQDGMICYVNSEPYNRYVDTIGLACPFLCIYAKTYDAPEYEELAYHQINSFLQQGMLTDACLPVHAYNSKLHLPLGVYGWGRGIGWLTLGIEDSYYYLSDEHRQQLCSKIEKIADNLISFQQKDGGFNSIVQGAGRYDSSATASIGYFLMFAYELTQKELYKERASLCLNRLKAYTRITGKIDYCQGDVKAIGIFAQTYDILPFAQGMAVRLFKKLSKVELKTDGTEK